MFDWIQYFADWLIYGVFGVGAETHLGAALNFFVYDTLKILLLLFLITFLMGIVNAYFPVERLRNFLGRNKLHGGEYLLASVFGAVTPFCSCSSVPLFIGFVQGGIPLGVTFSFLITSPLVNEVALAMFLGMFGWKTTLIYATSGILLGTVGGWVLGKMNLQNYLSDWVKQLWENAQHETEALEADAQTFAQRLPGIARGAWDIVKSVVLYVIIGIGIGAAMHGYVPENFFNEYLSGGQWWTVPLAVIIAVPLYANAAGILPVIQVLVAKGVPLGTAIAFMMGTVGLSLPEATLLKKVMTMKLIAIFFGTVAAFIILSGYLFNLIL
ncbi:MAG: permease [Saprospiraceae bacterium]|nr:permease [Saprospiraceae bacterium]